MNETASPRDLTRLDDLVCPACRDEADYWHAVNLAVDCYRHDGIRSRIPSLSYFGECECPRCFCSARPDDHTAAQKAGCARELELFGDDVLPMPGSPAQPVLPVAGGWVSVAAWRADRDAARRAA